MSLPASWSAVRVFGTYLQFDGSPAVGSVTFESAYAVHVDGDDGKPVCVLPRLLTVPLDASGHFETDLPTTDDPDITPTGWAYHVREQIAGGREFDMFAVTGADINLVTAVPVVPVPDLATTQGPPNILTVGTVTALPAGSAPTFEIVGNSPAQVVNVGMPQGDVTPEAQTLADQAAESATAAGISETNAAASATAAGTSETNAAASATAAGTSETNAAASATAAGTSETNAAASATAAGTSATNAATSETNSATNASAAGTSATNAAASAQSASDSAIAVDASSTSAQTSATNAAASATAAGTSETNAAASATAASTSATNAATSEANAGTSETSAAAAATAAGTSETNAAASATAAGTSETNAAASATAASTSATNAATSETNAATSASEAASSAATATSALAGIPVKNYLINGDFVINQRTSTTSPLLAGTYGYDRWKAGATDCTFSLNAGVLTHTSGPLVQVIEAPNLAGVTVTVSVGDLTSGDLNVDIDGVTGTITAGAGRRGVTLVVPSSSTGNVTLTLTPAAGAVTYKQAQLERGSTASAFEFRSAAIEWALCLRYCERVGSAVGGAAAVIYGMAVATDATTFQLFLNFSNKRARPTLSTTGGTLTLLWGSASTSAGQLTTASVVSNSTMLVNGVGATGLTAGQTVFVKRGVPTSDKTFIEAEL